MSLENNPNEEQGPLSDESTGADHGEIIRDYELAPDSTWRAGKPNYAKVNKVYFAGRTTKHTEGSLEQVVTKLLNNWEVESHHVHDINEWKSMDIAVFKASLNGGCPCSAQSMADFGAYNLLLGDVDGSTVTKAFPEGFAWEVLEIHSGPPNVSFKWRHFGVFCGQYTDPAGSEHAGTGKLISVFGTTIVTISPALQISSLEVYYDPWDLTRPLMDGLTPDARALTAPGRVDENELVRLPVQLGAPDFVAEAVLANGQIGEIKLSKFQGQKYVILLFYPLDFTFVCPSEILAFDDRYKEFRKRKAEIIGISIDSKFTHQAWRKTARADGGIGQIQFPLVSDVKKAIAADYGILCDAGVALRGLFIIDKAGTVRHALVNDLPLGRSVDEAIRVLDALQFNEGSGNVCPCNWTKGQTALLPNMASVASYLKQNFDGSKDVLIGPSASPTKEIIVNLPWKQDTDINSLLSRAREANALNVDESGPADVLKEWEGDDIPKLPNEQRRSWLSGSCRRRQAAE